MKLSELKLSPSQERALRKLMRNGRWLSAYELQESRNTLDALYRRELVWRKGVSSVGAMADPAVTIKYKSRYKLVGGKG